MNPPTLKARLTVYKIPGKTFHLVERQHADFQFPNVSSQATGSITLIDRKQLEFGDTADVYVNLTFPQLVGNAMVGTTFQFVNGSQLLGEGVILEFYDEAILLRANYPGMTVNERLIVSGKFDEYETAKKMKDSTRMMQLLYSVGVDINSTKEIIRQNRGK